MSFNLYKSLITEGLAATRPAIPDQSDFRQFFYATDTGEVSLWSPKLAAWAHAGVSAFTRNPNVAALGSTVADAAPVAAGFTAVTGANATVGVVLPTAPVAGTVVIIKNTVAAVLKVYPDAAATINAIGSHANIALAASVAAVFIADSPTQWYTLPLLPS